MTEIPPTWTPDEAVHAKLLEGRCEWTGDLSPLIRMVESLADTDADRIIAAEQAAARAAFERAADRCVEVWRNELDNTTQNGLADGCLASAEAIRKLAEVEE